MCVSIALTALIIEMHPLSDRHNRAVFAVLQVNLPAVALSLVPSINLRLHLPLFTRAASYTSSSS